MSKILSKKVIKRGETQFKFYKVQADPNLTPENKKWVLKKRSLQCIEQTAKGVPHLIQRIHKVS
jgi:hypothetical protein